MKVANYWPAPITGCTFSDYFTKALMENMSWDHCNTNVFHAYWHFAIPTLWFVTHQFNIVTLTDDAKLMPEMNTATLPFTWQPHGDIEGTQLCVLFLHVEIIACSTTEVSFKVCL